MSEQETDDLDALDVDREIDGVTYRIRPLPFGTGRRALMRLTKIVSPIVSAALRDGDEKPDRLAMVSRALEKLPEVLGDADVEYFAKAFGDCSWFHRDGKLVPLVPANQERHFAGRYLAFAQWLVECLKLNFGPFIAGVTSGRLGALGTIPEAG